MEQNTNLRRLRWLLRLMGWINIPMLGYVSPRLNFIDHEKAAVTIRLRRRTRNHLKSMYFGALAVGADVVAGMHVYYFCDREGVRPSFAFRSMQVDFHRRATTSVMFSTNEGVLVEELVKRAIETKERQNAVISVTATDKEGEVVATFKMGISVKITF
jgi:acyl-coenzyme A thioesterase PaaI-like protein